MFAIEYIKQNPASVGRAISEGNWRKLLTDKACPYGVKCELQEMYDSNIPITETNIYFMDKMLARKFSGIKGRNTIVPAIAVWKACVRWLDMLYSYAQNNAAVGTTEYRVMRAFNKLSADRPIGILPINYDELKIFMNGRDCDNVELLNAVNSRLFQSDDDILRESEALSVLSCMDITWLRMCDKRNLKKAAEYAKDTIVPNGTVFNCLRDLKLLHDQQAKEKIKKLIEENGTALLYDPLLIHIVKKYGFRLPMSKADFILRGQNHNNCVANYYESQLENSPELDEYYTRLVFTKEATAELEIAVEHDRIVSVRVPQFKGRFNKTHTHPETLTLLRIALTGMPAAILKVREEEV